MTRKITKTAWLSAITGLIAIMTAIGCSSPPPPEEPESTGMDPETRREIAEMIREEVSVQITNRIPPTPTPAPKPTPTPEPTRPPPNPTEGICPRDGKFRKAIMDQIPDRFCEDITTGDLYKIRQLQVTTSRATANDLRDFFNLEELEIDGIREPLEPGTFSDLHNLERLRIHTIEKPDSGENLLNPGTFNGLSKLRSLRVSSDDGWTAYELNENILQGLENLEELEINYIESLNPRAFENMRELQSVQIHVSIRGGEVYERVPRSMFGNMEDIQRVHVQNLRWPPILDVASREAACQARHWTSQTGGNSDDNPLSVRIGNSNRNTDLESMEGCEDRPR